MAKVLQRLDILLHANTANYVRDMKRATDQTKKELKTVADYGKIMSNQIGMAFATLGSAVSVSHIVQTADRMQDLASKVRINTKNTEEYNAVLQDLRKISTDYWTAIDGVTDLYASSKRALDSLGASQRQVLDFTRNITMAMSVGGGSAQAQEAALIQLGQAMSMGVLRGQEFNSVSAQAPVIIDLLTDSLKVSRGELRAMAADGKITSQVMMNAVLSGHDKLQETINKMPTTFAQGVQNIKSQYDFLVDDVMNQNSLLSQNLASVALWTAEHFRTLVGVGTAVGAVWLANIARNSALATSFVSMTGATIASTKASIANAFSVQGQANAYNVLSTRMMLLRLTKAQYIDITKTALATTVAYSKSLVGLATGFNTATASARMYTVALAGVTTAKRTAMGVSILATRAVTGVGSAFVSLGRVILAHPLLTLTAVVGAVIARTQGLNKAIESLGDAFSVAGVLAVDFIGGVVDGAGMALTAVSNFFDKMTGGAEKATSFSQTVFGGFFAGTEKGFVGVLQAIARTFDLGGATVVWFVNFADKNIKALGTAIGNTFKGIGNAIAWYLEKALNNAINQFNVMIKGMSAVSEFFGGSAIPTIEKATFARAEYKEVNFTTGGSIADYNTHDLENYILRANKQVQANKKAQQALANGYNGLADSATKATKATDKKTKADEEAKKAAEEARKAQEQLMKSYAEQVKSYVKQQYEGTLSYVNELKKIQWETRNAQGSFFSLSEEHKKILETQADSVDVVNIVKAMNEKLTSYKSQLNTLRGKTSLDELTNDFRDKTNIFHDINQIQANFEYGGKKVNAQTFLLKHAIDFEYEKNAYEFDEVNRQAEKEIQLLSAKNELQKQFMQYNQEHLEFLGKYKLLENPELLEEFQQFNALIEAQTRVLKHNAAKKEVVSFVFDSQKVIKNYEHQLDFLNINGQLQKDIYNISEERLKTLEKYNHLLEDGFGLEYQMIETATANLEKKQGQLLIHTAYKELSDGLLSSEQKTLNVLKEQMEVLALEQSLREQYKKDGMEYKGLGDTNQLRMQLLDNALGLPKPAMSPIEQQMAEYQRQQDILKQFEDTAKDIYAENEAQKTKILEEATKKREEVQANHEKVMRDLQMVSAQDIFGSLSSIAKDGLGEQSKAYRAIFAMEKGVAIARSVMAIQQAMALAAANPYPMNLGAMATVASQVASIVSNIKAVAMPVGQAHDGIMSVPKSGTWNLEKGERVLPKHTAQNLDRTLNNIQGGNGKQVIINQHITINANGTSDVKQDSNQNQIGQALKQGMVNVVLGEMRQGGAIYNFVKNSR